MIPSWERGLSGGKRGRARISLSEYLQLEELIESLGPQTGFQFLVIGPELGVEVQGQGDERGAFKSTPSQRRRTCI